MRYLKIITVKKQQKTEEEVTDEVFSRMTRLLFEQWGRGKSVETLEYRDSPKELSLVLMVR